MKTRQALCITLILALMGCGQKPPADEPGGGTDEGKEGKEADATPLQILVDRLNTAIAKVDKDEAEALIEPQTADMLVEVMELVPEWEPVGDPTSLADYLTWEKVNGISFKLKNEDTETGKGTIVAIVGGLEDFEGLVAMVGQGDDAQLEFLDFAAERRDEVLSQGLAREKLLQIVEKVNKAIAEKDPKLLQESLTNDTINNEVKLYSYFTGKKSNLSPKGLVKMFNKSGYTFSASKIDVDSGDAVLTVTDGQGNEVLKGDMVFRSEIGKMRLDYAALLETRIAEEQEKLDAKKSGKGKKKGK